jgi:hypothetical protein
VPLGAFAQGHPNIPGSYYIFGDELSVAPSLEIADGQQRRIVVARIRDVIGSMQMSAWDRREQQPVRRNDRGTSEIA